jgi:signal transduction histidine kinase
VTKTILICHGSTTIQADLVALCQEYGWEGRPCGSVTELVAAAGMAVAAVVDATMPAWELSAVCLRSVTGEPLPTLLLNVDGLPDGPASETAGTAVLLEGSYDRGAVAAVLTAWLQSRSEPPATLLLVDDSPTFLAAARAALETAGFGVVEAVSGEAALAMLARTSVDCVLLDFVLPGMSGLTVCRRIKADSAWRETPLLFLTGREDEDTLVACLEAGADDYVTKSSPFSVLISRVRAQLRRRHYEMENRRLRLAAAQARAAQELAEARALLLADLHRQNLALAAEKRAQEEARDRLDFLNNAGVRLIDALHQRRLSQALAELLVPRLADACIVSRLLPDERTADTAVAGEGAWSQMPVDLVGDTPLAAHVAQALGQGRPVRLDPRQIPGARDLAVVQVLPLQTPGRRVGVVVIGRRQATALGVDDQVMLDELLRRAALAMENVRLVEEAHAAVQARDEFLSMASHELRTPLTSLQLQLESLVRLGQQPALVPADRLQAKLGVILRQAYRLARLVGTMLDISRITAGRLVIDYEHVDLARVVRDVVASFRQEAADAGIEVRVSIAPVVGLVDRLRLEQVVTNLLSNAIKYGNGRPVSITLRQEGDRASLTVQDQGIGIAEADQAQLFHRFERLVSGRNISGFGLGLWIVHEILEAMHGTIALRSQPGMGSTFTVTIPLVPPQTAQTGVAA